MREIKRRVSLKDTACSAKAAYILKYIVGFCQLHQIRSHVKRTKRRWNSLVCHLKKCAPGWTHLSSAHIISLSSFGNKPAISPVARIALMYSKKFSSMMSESVNMKVTLLPSLPVIAHKFRMSSSKSDVLYVRVSCKTKDQREQNCD